jgi:hypothetical protein
MTDHTAIAAVSRTLRTLLRDRMTAFVPVTLAPPDINVVGLPGPRINLYLFQVSQDGNLSNQEIPGHTHRAAYGRPPLSLTLKFLVTSYSQQDDQPDSDVNAQVLLGDAMRVLHDLGGRIEAQAITRPAVGIVGQPILDAALRNEFERIKLTLHPANLEELVRLWSAMPDAAFRRSVVYEASVVQIESRRPHRVAPPVEERRVFVSTARRPFVADAYVTPPLPTDPRGEMRVRIAEQITLECEAISAARLYVRLGGLEPIRVPLPSDGNIRIPIPDNQYPIDLDHPAVRPIPPAIQLQPGPLIVQVIAVHQIEGVTGALDLGATILDDRASASNIALFQLVPRITAIAPVGGPAATVLQINGTRLWNPDGPSEVLIRDAPITVRAPQPGDPWVAPTPVMIQVPVADADALLPPPPAGGTPYPVAVQVNGARSRDAFNYTLTP